MKNQKRKRITRIILGVVATVLALLALAAIMLVISPVDAIPDFIPYFIGYIDDVFVGLTGLAATLGSFVATVTSIVMAIKGKAEQQVVVR